MNHELAFKIYARVMADKIMSAGKNWKLKEEQARQIAEAAIEATALFVTVVNEHEQRDFTSAAAVMARTPSEETPKSDE